MPAYGLLFGGAAYTIPRTGLRLSVQGSNLLNKAAFNDIDARNGESITDVTMVSPYNIIKPYCRGICCLAWGIGFE